jgi:two-component system, OmpR family, sensor histidine kinase CpxA
LSDVWQDVSHELRSPLARLSFAAELMRAAANSVETLNRMRLEVIRLSQLIDNLLEVTRLEGDSSSDEAHWFSFDSLMREVLRDCVFEAEARNVEIKSKLTEGLEVQGNPELLRRALENVLRNAIRFSPANSSVQAGVEEDLNGITVAVTDSGPGVQGRAGTQQWVVLQF